MNPHHKQWIRIYYEKDGHAGCGGDYRLRILTTLMDGISPALICMPEFNGLNVVPQSELPLPVSLPMA